MIDEAGERVEDSAPQAGPESSADAADLLEFQSATAVQAPSGDETRRLSRALERLSARIESAESRQAIAIAGVERSMREVIARIDATEREQADAAAKFQNALAKTESAHAALAERMANVEAAREDLGRQLSATTEARFERVEQAIAEMAEHVRAAERRSTGALERMGREVLEVAQALSRRVQRVEHQSAQAADRVNADVARMADAVQDRLARADAIQAQALERLGGEIARITQRLADRIASAERRSAEAIENVGEQVARTTERIGERHERATNELSERIRQTEERTARLLEAAQQRIDESLAHARVRAAPTTEAAPAEEVSALFLEDAAVEEALAEAPLADEIVTPEPFAPEPFAPEPFAPEPFAPEPFADEIFAVEDAPAPDTFAAAPLEEASTTFDDDDFEAVARFHRSFLEADLEDEPSPPAEDLPPELEPVALAPNVGFDMDDAAFDAHAEPLESLFADTPSVEPAEPVAASEAPQPVETAIEAEPALAEVETPAEPLTTRELIERARAAARNAPEKAGRVSLLEQIAFGRSRRRGGGFAGALMVASLLAAVSLSAGGYLLLEARPDGKLPKPLADALGGGADASAHPNPAASAPTAASPAAQPLAALALVPKPAAEAADVPALFATAVEGADAGRPDAVDAVRQLAEQGYAPAQFYVSRLYEEGKDGLDKDPIKARGWLERAAQGGDRAAMHNLALDYFEGQGGPRDAAAAAEWFRRAAKLGLIDSQFNLAGLYEHGDGVTRNTAEAFKWYLIAARSGDAEARQAAARLSSDLTPEARAVAAQAAAAFTAADPAPAGPPSDVVTAQTTLGQLGYYEGPSDGVASPALHLAIAAYQRDQGLPVTGVTDAGTLAKLGVSAR